MTPTLVVELGRDALELCFMIAGPLLLATLLVGLVMSVIQAITHLQEQTLTFVPKLFVVAGLLGLMLPWILRVLNSYTTSLFRLVPDLGP